MKKWLSALSVLLIATFVLSACGYSKESETNKYNAYAGISTLAFVSLETKLKIYKLNFGFEKEIDLSKEKDLRRFGGVNIVGKVIDIYYKNVDEALAFASKKPSFGAADETMKELAPQLKSYMDLINEVEDYYSSWEFAKDDFERGKKLHKKLVTQYYSYTKLAKQLARDLKEITKKKDQESLVGLKKEGYLLHLHAKSIIMKSQDFIQQFVDDGLELENASLEKVDSAAYQEQLRGLLVEIKLFSDYSKDEERIKKEKIVSFAGFDKELPEFEKQAMSFLLTFSGQASGQGNEAEESLASRIYKFEEQMNKLIYSFNIIVGNSARQH
ncbi:DUF3829 domain-containing protein [Cohnella terricola]|uniref:DUF3829 domain-containing protein n=1 Tax=Cohnella terricola TaxID=1289167 RepID=UPI001645C284|nr:DUF3829 domain-containing protein [Cohnella terricola]